MIAIASPFTGLQRIASRQHCQSVRDESGGGRNKTEDDAPVILANLRKSASGSPRRSAVIHPRLSRYLQPIDRPPMLAIALGECSDAHESRAYGSKRRGRTARLAATFK